MTWPESTIFGFFAGCLVGAITAMVIVVVMVTFSIGETPVWALGVWALWVLAWAAGIAVYVKGKDW